MHSRYTRDIVRQIQQGKEVVPYNVIQSIVKKMDEKLERADSKTTEIFTHWTLEKVTDSFIRSLEEDLNNIYSKNGFGKVHIEKVAGIFDKCVDLQIKLKLDP